MRRAVNLLYEVDLKTLSDDDNSLYPEVSLSFSKVVNWLHNKKEYNAEMLSEEEPSQLINSIHNVLAQPITNLKQNIPKELTSALLNNCFIFSGFKAHRELQEASLLLLDESGTYKPFERFLNDVKKIDNTYNSSYLEAEYNQAVQSTQMAVKWNDFAKDGDQYNLQYRTAGDEKVRASHAALNEITLPFSDPFWSSYLPPNGWNCRCTVEQVRKEKYQVSDSKEAIETGNFITEAPKDKIFRFNPGKEMKLFPEKHPYYKTKDADTIYNQSHILQAYKQAGEFNSISKKIADKVGVSVTQVNLKGRDRIIEKADNDYQGNIRKVKDIIRNTFIVDSENFTSKAKEIIDNFDVAGDVKYQDTPEGYTGMLFNTRINGIVAECQINTPQMIYGKQKNAKDILPEDIYIKLNEEAKKQGISEGKGHDYYKKIRSLDDEKNKEEIKKLREESKEYYKKIRGLKIKTSYKK